MAKDQILDEMLSIEATTMYENSLLGVLISYPSMIDDVSGVIEVGDMLNTSSKLLYASLLELNVTGAKINLVTVLDNLDKKNQLATIGGIVAVAKIQQQGGAKENVVTYAEIIKKRSTARQLVSAGSLITELGKGGGDVQERIALAHEALDKISGEESTKDFYHVKDLLDQVTSKIDSRITEGSTGLMTEFTHLDEKLNGLKGGDLIIIAGRPSMGKTILGMQIATAISMNKVTPSAAAVFSLEMTKDQLVERAISQLGKIDATRLATGALEDEDYDGLVVATGKLYESNLYINDESGLTHQKIFVKARALAKQVAEKGTPLGVIVIDYLQIMGYSGAPQNRDGQIGDISRSLKKLAKELNVPIVLLSQLNRGVEQRADKRPVMSDLRESGAIEQDADIIIMAYRDEYYNPDSEYKGVCELLIRKNRNGPLATIGLGFEGNYVRMSNLDRGWVSSHD